jgi:N,N'-diacetylchitobiose transport system substrate-binding protein
LKRTATAAILAAVTVLATATACSSSSSGSSDKGSGLKLATNGKGKTITVWLQGDAKGWQNVVDSTNRRFTAATGAKVNIQWQNWQNYTTKLDSMFAGSTNIPDVVEFGNTQTASYMAAGALADLSGVKQQFANSSTWQKGLADTANYDGKLYAVPYYGGVRVVIYRKDVWSKAGVTTPPGTIDELFSDLDKIKAANSSDKSFSAFYMPGQYWYAAMSFVHAAGGTIATQKDGKWVAALDSPQAQQGLETWKRLATQYSVGGATVNEANQDAVMAKGHVATIFGAGWELGVVADPKTGDPKLKDQLATFAMPGTSAGSYMPSFFGGSDLAVPQKSKNAGLGAKWIQLFTDDQSQKALAKFAIPNSTSLLATYKAQGDANTASGQAASQTWVTPTSPNWANVESSNILQNMLQDIATGKSSIADATKAADAKIDSTLNAS